MARLFGFLESIRAVWLGRACLTEEGANYMGVPFAFPVVEQDERSPQAVPNDVERLKARIIASLADEVAS